MTEMAFRAGNVVCFSYQVYLILGVFLLPVVSSRIKINYSFVSRGQNVVEAIVINIVEAETMASSLTCLIFHLECGKSNKQRLFQEQD